MELKEHNGLRFYLEGEGDDTQMFIDAAGAMAYLDACSQSMFEHAMSHGTDGVNGDSCKDHAMQALGMATMQDEFGSLIQDALVFEGVIPLEALASPED